MNTGVAERWDAWVKSLIRTAPPAAGVRYLSQSSGMAQTAIRVLLGGTTPRADAIAWDAWVDSCRDTGPASRPSLLTEYATQSDGQRRAIDRLLAHVDPGEIPAKLAAQNWVGLWQMLTEWAADAGVDIGGQSEVIEALRIIRAAERGADTVDDFSTEKWWDDIVSETKIIGGQHFTRDAYGCWRFDYNRGNDECVIYIKKNDWDNAYFCSVEFEANGRPQREFRGEGMSEKDALSSVLSYLPDERKAWGFEL